MYIIEEEKAYLVDGEVGYLINFDTTGKMLIDKDNEINVLGKQKYTYDEMYRKLNVAYVIEQAKRQQFADENANEVVKELNAKIDELTKENENLKAQLKELETKAKEVVKEQLETVEDEVVEENEPEKKEENTSKKK